MGKAVVGTNVLFGFDPDVTVVSGRSFKFDPEGIAARFLSLNGSLAYRSLSTCEKLKTGSELRGFEWKIDPGLRGLASGIRSMSCNIFLEGVTDN